MKSLTAKCLVAFALIFCSLMAYADGDRQAIPNNSKWKEECGSCHITYPPKLLTAENWQHLMGGLDKHFGVNATMDAKDSQGILDFLKRNAGSGNKHSTSSLRISDTPWFKREHDEISASTWSNPEIKSRSNCTACHVKAERGDWSEHGIRIPGEQRIEYDN